MAIGKCAATLVALTLGRLVPVLGGNYHNNCESDQQQALCIQDQCSANKGSGSLQCTGDDLSSVKLTTTYIEQACKSTKGTAKFTAKLEVDVESKQVFDIGLFVPTAGQDDAFYGQCEIYVFGCNTGHVDDGDNCGDVGKGVTTFEGIEIEVPCTNEDIEYCVSWSCGKDKKSDDGCYEPKDATPRSSDKCMCGTICIPKSSDCNIPGTVCKDPVLQGLHGQNIKWVGEEGAWYALFVDEEIDMQVNVRTTGPLPEDFPNRQYVTGVSILHHGHSMVIEVIEPYSGDTPGCPDGVFPCLADGGLRFVVDGQESNAFLSPIRNEIVEDAFELSSSNLPLECHEFGGGEEWELLYEEMRRGDRELAEPSFEEWVLSYPHMVAPEWCAKYISEIGLADEQSKQSVLRIVTADVIIRFSVGVNHRQPGKIDRFGRELPELDFWQSSVGLYGINLDNERLTGILGETARPVRDTNGEVITKGIKAMRGIVADYRVSSPVGKNFALLHKDVSTMP